MLKFFKKLIMTKKRICHVGAWSGNFGDNILQTSIKDQLLEFNSKLEFVYYNCQKTEFTKELIKNINNTCDLLLIGGGGLIFNRPQDKSKSGWQWNIDINDIDNINIPIVVYGIGYNKFEYDKNEFKSITNEHLVKTVAKSTLFSVRNNGTKEYLVSIGCNPSKIEVIPDPGMFAKNFKIDIPGLNGSKIKIGLNWTTDREDQTFPTPWLDSKRFFQKELIKALNHISKEFAVQFVYIGHMSYEFDKDIIEIFKDGLNDTPIIIDECLKEIYPPEIGKKAGNLVDVYRQMDLVLGMRGHSNIVSFGQNTPCIAIGSHRKLRYFKYNICDEGNIIDVRDIKNINEEKIYNLIRKNIEQLDERKDILSKELAKQRKIEMDFNKKIMSIIS